ncbi:MAG: citrate lyase acyl carrier protein [Synergistaceae bacterium]|jgi:citrate lyase subunit gamma (acyl carrier protein)|nr:citrate lyase acyl carrier protein [Synergistaceae bacterium]
MLDSRTAQAGTLESMDCLVTVTGPADGRVIEISGSSAPRFKISMERRVNDVLDSLGCDSGVRVAVQDNGALDIVLGARVEAAFVRYREGDVR